MAVISPAELVAGSAEAFKALWNWATGIKPKWDLTDGSDMFLHVRFRVEDGTVFVKLIECGRVQKISWWKRGWQSTRARWTSL